MACLSEPAAAPAPTRLAFCRSARSRRQRVVRLLCLALLLLLALAAVSELVAAGRDFYAILGVPKNANDRQLKKAYHKLSRKWHPDKNKAENAEKKFVEISNAYEVLSEPKTRKIYDEFGEEGLKQGGPGPQQQQQQQHQQQQHHQGGFGGGGGMPGQGGGGGFSFGDPMNIFSQFFSGGMGGGGMGGGMGGRTARGGMPRGGSPGMGGMGGGGMPGGFGGGMPGGMHGGMAGQPGGPSKQDGPSKIIALTSASPGPLARASSSGKARHAKENWLIEFMSPSCGHCQALEPEIQKAARSLAGIVKVAQVDCTQSQELCSANGVKGYPTIKLFKAGSHDAPEEYRGERTVKAIYNAATAMLPSNFVTILQPSPTALESFVSAGSDGKAHVVLVAPKLSPAYKVLSVRYSPYMRFGLLATGGDSKRLALAHGALGIEDSDPSNPYSLRVIFRERDHVLDYQGAMKLKDLDAFLYEQAKLVKKDGGGSAKAASKDDSSGARAVVPLSPSELHSLVSGKRSGYTVLLLPGVGQGSAAQRTLAAMFQRAAEGLPASTRAKLRLLSCVGEKQSGAGFGKAVSAVRSLFPLSSDASHPHLLVVKQHASGLRFHAFDLRDGAAGTGSSQEEYVAHALQEIMQGNVKFTRVDKVPSKDALDKMMK